LTGSYPSPTVDKRTVRLRTGRKLVLLLALAGVAGLGGAAVLCWPELQTAWYLAQLRCETGSSLFDGALISSHPPLLEACQRYVREPEGGSRLVKAFIREVDSCAPPSGDPGRSSVLLDPLLDDPASPMAIAVRKKAANQTFLSVSRKTAGHFSFSMAGRSGPRYSLLLKLLALCAGKTYQIAWPVGCPYGDGCNDLYVHVTSAASIRAATSDAAGDDAEYFRRLGWPEFHGLGALPAGVEHVCLVRRGPDNPGISLEFTPSGPAAPFQELELDLTPSAPPGSPR
jgi:hypothetical protein